MCGIAGIFSFGKAATPAKGELARMIGALHHRGPDGSSTFIDGPTGLAGTGFDAIDTGNSCNGAGFPVGGGTGWLEMSGNVEPGEIMKIRFAVWDAGGHLFDALVLLDDAGGELRPAGEAGWKEHSLAALDDPAVTTLLRQAMENDAGIPSVPEVARDSADDPNAWKPRFLRAQSSSKLRAMLSRLEKRS